MKELMQIIKDLKDRMNIMEQKQSEFINNVHGVSTDGIRESESTIIDLEIEIAQLDARVTALEEKESE